MGDADNLLSGRKAQQLRVRCCRPNRENLQLDALG